LLRVLETGEFIRVGSSEVRKTNVRIVAATNVNMQKAIVNRKFREDLYYRLNTIPIQIPALRERKEDIPLLFRKFAGEIAEKYNMPPVRLVDEAARQVLVSYKWPGNIRQLKSVTEQLSVLSAERQITPKILSQFIPQDQESTQLATIHTESERSFENEREILYKILFELRSNVNDMRREISTLKKQIEDKGDDRPSASLAATQLAPTNFSPLTSHLSPLTEDAVAEEYIEPENEPENLNVSEWSRQALEKALERNGGNRKKAAQEMGISDRTLYRRLKQYGLDKDK
jgi:DNA-binding NtrC family response regulator